MNVKKLYPEAMELVNVLTITRFGF